MSLRIIGKNKCIALPLWERFEGESGEGFYFVAVSPKPNSRLYIVP